MEFGQNVERATVDLLRWTCKWANNKRAILPLLLQVE
jgi:hypothetical protein